MLTRREVLRRAATQKTDRVESCRTGTAGRQDHAGAVLRLPQAGRYQRERDRLFYYWCRPTPAQTGSVARGREPAGYHPGGQWVRAALPLARPPPGDDRLSRQDAESAGGAF